MPHALREPARSLLPIRSMPRRKAGAPPVGGAERVRLHDERARAGILVQMFELNRHAIEAAMVAAGRISPNCEPISDEHLVAQFSDWMAELVAQTERDRLDPVRALDVVNTLARAAANVSRGSETTTA